MDSDAVDLVDWPVSRLKKELVDRGARTTGRKTQLIDRLRAYIRNDNFTPASIKLPEPSVVDWPTSGFKQLQKDHHLILRKISKEQIEAYFIYRMADDRQARNDLKSITKGQLMYESDRVSYIYKIKLDKKSGDPVNTHCECPAGKGPHGSCKHIAAVLLMIKEFTESRELRLGKSCTDTLMMFTKPKSSYDVKAENLPTKRKLAADFLSDPRPEKRRNCPGYNDYVQSIVTNYCSQSSNDISFRYMYGKANIQAAVKDHDYCQLPFTEHWVDDSIKVTESDVVRIEESTRQQSASQIWFIERKWRLTASKFGEICKATSRRNTKKLCAALLSDVQINSEALRHGKNYKAKALKVFNSKFNVNAKKCGFFVCLDKPFLGASPDAVVDGSSIVEIKCPFNGRNDVVKPGKNFKFLKYDDEGKIVLKTSSKYYDQIQGQLYVTKRSLCYFVVYTLSDLFVQKILFDDEYCNNCLLPKLETFYKTFFRSYVASLF
ncbi:uncharacterized protein LOC134265512 [Saccostrea cucullata]|uniref:uncharacterized protein LOC134265512 n=1 Tax=Saccostrea cuccullata TaxID=36930 RepID=UPI002ED00202